MVSWWQMIVPATKRTCEGEKSACVKGTKHHGASVGSLSDRDGGRAKKPRVVEGGRERKAPWGAVAEVAIPKAPISTTFLPPKHPSFKT